MNNILISNVHKNQMLKIGTITTIILCSFVFNSCNKINQDKIRTGSVTLPLIIKDGYGPFYPNYDILHGENLSDPIWSNIYLPVEGIPKNLSNVTKCLVWLESYQLVYQNYKAKKISQENYQLLKNQWGWNPDTTQLSSKPIKCYIYVIKGYDENTNKWAVVVDSNNDLNFANEKIIYPEIIKTGAISDKIRDPQNIQYEIYQHGKILRKTVKMVFKIMGDQFLYNFAQYATSIYKKEGENYNIFISSGFMRLDFEKTFIALESDFLNSGKLNPDKIVKNGDKINIDGEVYINSGVNIFNELLTLSSNERTNKNRYDLNLGSKFFPFSAKKFPTNNYISLKTLEGKYVYIDFWGTWCKGCVQQISDLREKYRNLDKSRFEFLGISCHDSSERVKTFLHKEQITWPQIIDSDSNNFVKLYNLKEFPTSLLIDPNGYIIAKNIYGDKLSEILNKLDKNKNMK